MISNGSVSPAIGWVDERFSASRCRTAYRATPQLDATWRNNVKRYLMCRPTYFTVDYGINPWMDPTAPADTDLAVAQWTNLRDTYRRPRAHRRRDRPDPRPARHGLRRQRRDRHRRHRLRRPVPLPRARRRGPGVPELVRATPASTPTRPRRSTRARATSCSPAVPARRHRLPHRPRRARRGAGAASAARSSRCSWSTRASTTSTPRSPCSATRSRLPARGVLRRRSRRGAAPAVPRRDRGVDRPTPPCSASTPCRDGHNVVLPVRHGPGRRSCASAATARTGRPVRAAQGRRRPQVLHAGAAERVMTMTTNRTAAAVAEAERWTAHNYHPLPVVIADAEGAWVTDVDGQRYLDCLAGYSALNFGHRHPALIAAARTQLDRVTLTSRAFHHDQLGAVLPRPRRAVRQGPGAADEHRRRGRRDGDQGRPQVGLPGQGRAGRAGDHRRRRRQLPRPHHDDRQLLHRPRRARRLRPVHARASAIVPYGDLAALRGRDRRDHGRRADRADPGRGRRPRAAGRLPAGRPRAVHASRTCCSSPTRSSPASAAPATRSRCDHEGVEPDLYLLGKALGGGIVPVSAVVVAGRRARRAPARRARLDVRRQPARLRGRPRRRRPAAHRRVPGAGPRARRAPARAAGRADRPRASPPSAAAACGPASTSTRR